MLTEKKAVSKEESGFEKTSRHWAEPAINLHSASTWTAMGDELREEGQLRTAMRCYENALSAGGDVALNHLRLAEAALLLGDFAGGWSHFEFRHDAMPGQDWMVPHYPFPQWSGEALSDKTILVRRERALSDEIMFASLVPELVHAAGHVVLTCHPSLERMFARSFPAATVVGEKIDFRIQNYTVEETASVDYQCFSGSVARFRRQSIAHFPSRGRYLQPDAQRALYWRGRLDSLGSDYSVGLRWHQGAWPGEGSGVSTELDFWVPLLAQHGVHFVSLQDGPQAADAQRVGGHLGVPIHCWPEAVADVESTSALMNELDLIITVASPLANIAGALGKPTWVMTPRIPDWRYGVVGDSIPWYPNMRVFRQAAQGGWGRVIDHVAAALMMFINRF